MRSLNINDFYYKTYFENSKEFEEVRDLCLSENNWLRHIFTRERLSIEEHMGFNVVYSKSTNEPVVFGGVFNNGYFPKNVARMCNRFYTFPNWRGLNFYRMTEAWKIVDTYIIKPLIELNAHDCYFMAMQTRIKKQSKGYFQVWHESLRVNYPEWQVHDRHLQTVPFNVKNCWQNFVYLDLVPDAFDKWNPKTIDDTEWLSLEQGID